MKLCTILQTLDTYCALYIQHAPDIRLTRTELKEILIAQKKETEQILKQDNIIEREILLSSKKYIDTGIIKVITGIRRCGKSVFSHQILNKKKYAYANFDDERLFML